MKTFTLSLTFMTALTAMVWLVPATQGDDEKDVVPEAKPVSKANSKEIPVAKPVSPAELDEDSKKDSKVKPEPIIEEEALSKVVSDLKVIPPTEEKDPTSDEPVVVNPAKADRNKDGKLTDRELALQDHREQLAIYDLNDDKKISEEEWKAANKEHRERDDKFHLVDKDEDGQIDEEEAVGFLLERISVSSTYVDTTDDANPDVAEKQIKDNAPSEVRFTLFSIPFGE